MPRPMTKKRILEYEQGFRPLPVEVQCSWFKVFEPDTSKCHQMSSSFLARIDCRSLGSSETLDSTNSGSSPTDLGFYRS